MTERSFNCSNDMQVKQTLNLLCPDAASSNSLTVCIRQIHTNLQQDTVEYVLIKHTHVHENMTHSSTNTDYGCQWKGGLTRLARKEGLRQYFGVGASLPNPALGFSGLNVVVIVFHLHHHTHACIAQEPKHQASPSEIMCPSITLHQVCLGLEITMGRVCTVG